MGNEWVEGIDRDVRSLNADEGWRDAVLGIDLDYRYDLRQEREQGIEQGAERA